MARRLNERAAYVQGFAASVSHEFKTPLTALRGTAELLRDHADEMTPAERTRFFGNLHADAERLSRLVHRLLELARADMTMPGTAESDVGAVFAMVARESDAAGPRTVFHAPQGLRAQVDGAALSAVLLAFLENARQHGGPDVQVAVTAKRDGAWVVVGVSDDGTGISPANAARIFEPFFTTAREHGGTGMGLTIAQALVRAHGGTVELVPAERGASFAIRLPAARGRQEPPKKT
jgi:signal transduction histidine kinase